MTHCTYITVHQSSGYFYIGEGPTRAVLASKYKGSGTKLKRFFHKFPYEDWDCGVLWEFDNKEEAFSDEAGIVTEELLQDPLCLNCKLGGSGGQSSEGSKKAAATLGTDGRRKRALKIAASQTPEQHSAKAKKRSEGMTTEERSDMMRVSKAAMTPKEKAEAARKRVETLGPERVKALAVARSLKKLEVTTHEERQASAMKGWDTMRENPEKIKAAGEKRLATMAANGQLQTGGENMSKVLRICPHCGHTGRGANIFRYHFDRCKFK